MNLQNLYHEFNRHYGQDRAFTEFLTALESHIDQKTIADMARKLKQPQSNLFRKPAAPVHDPRDVFGR
ncbi:MAG: hypothetical protein HY914_14510 [Desulfomonile tiedjei]|nr:hypothetical protein [Desulfomonile tiedjei]